nr:EOG090X0CGF [Triops cancriformis]
MCTQAQLFCRPFLPSQYRHFMRHFSSPAIDKETLSPLRSFVKQYTDSQLVPSTIAQIKLKSLAEDRRLTPVNFDGNFLKACAEENNYRLAKQYLHYLQSSGQAVNNAVLNRYLLLCYRNPSDFNESEILLTCEQLKSQSPVLDPSTAESLIIGFSITSQWRNSIELLTAIEPYTSVKSLCLNAIIKAALRNHDLELALQFMTRAAESAKTIDHSVYQLWLEDSKYNTEQLIQFWSDYEILPMAGTVKTLQDKLTGSNGSAKPVIIKAEGTCPACKKKLAANRLNKSEFAQLRSAFLERVLQGKDVFRGSTPKELELFRDFVAKNAPFGIVVDGLNVAYLHGKAGNKAINLVNLVKHYSNKCKILVLGPRTILLFYTPRYTAVLRPTFYHGTRCETTPLNYKTRMCRICSVNGREPVNYKF